MLWKMTLNGLYDYGQLRNDDLFEDIKNATVDELKKLPSMNEKSAKEVYSFFHK